MKLIIEIDNESYKGLVTESHIFVKPIFDAVKNGIPLDKIRAEIEALEPFDYLLEDYSDARRDALDIIDKYR